MNATAIKLAARLQPLAHDLAATLRNRALPALRRGFRAVRGYAAHHPSINAAWHALQPKLRRDGRWTPLARVSAATPCALAALGLCWGGGDTMPKVTAKDGKDFPASAQEEAQRIFDSRFAKVGDTYYTVRVSCLPGGGNPLLKIATLMGDPENKPAEAPPSTLLIGMELIQLDGLRATVETSPLSRADQLNHITWRGTFSVTTGAERRRNLDLLPALEAHLKANGLTSPYSVTWTERKLDWSLTASQVAALRKPEKINAEKTRQRENPAQKFKELLSAMLGEAMNELTASLYPGP